jgi:ubiquinone/menaquinone biosynthesis C-methylase UbiE
MLNITYENQLNIIRKNMSMYCLPFDKEDKVVELGGGSNPLYHPNYDNRRVKGVDFIADFSKPLPIISENFDGIYCKHALEYVSWRIVRFFLTECYRILSCGGVAIFITTNLLEQARILTESPSDKWNDSFISMIFGNQDRDIYDSNSHMSGFSPEYIKRILKGIGFKDIKISPIYSDFGPMDMIIECRK